MLGSYTLRGGVGPSAHLHGAEHGNGGGIIDDTLAKHQVEERRRAVLLQHLQHGHAVGGHEYCRKRQAVLPPTSQLCGPLVHANKKYDCSVKLKSTGVRVQSC